MKKLALIFVFCALRLSAATTWYLDSSVGTTGNGLAWATAAKTIADLQALAVTSGDLVYISGGSSGNTQTYATTMSIYGGQWFMTSGVTYKIGQDSAHNGTAIFDGGSTANAYIFVQTLSNVVISGDAGDGAMHFRVTNVYATFNSDNWNNVRLSYIDCTAATGQSGGSSLATAVEIDHCAFKTAGTGANAVMYMIVSGGGYAVNKIHHNSFLLQRVTTPTMSGGSGTDALEVVGSGISVYNNTFTTYVDATWTGNQHQDGWQPNGGAYYEAYNNLFVDLNGYSIFWEPASSGYNHARLYNNISWSSFTGDQAYVIAGNSSTGKICNDVYFANNIAVGYNYPYTIRNPSLGSDPTAFTNCFLQNNIEIDTQIGSIIDPAVTSSNNVILTNAQAATRFVAYARATSTNDYHLVLAATNMVGQGINLATVFTADADGVTRIVPWDIGPYRFLSLANATPRFPLFQRQPRR